MQVGPPPAFVNSLRSNSIAVMPRLRNSALTVGLPAGIISLPGTDHQKIRRTGIPQIRRIKLVQH